MITCENCGKTRQGQDIGNHWICGDCKIDENVKTEETNTDKRNVH
jgi:hypothetical protein